MKVRVKAGNRVTHGVYDERTKKNTVREFKAGEIFDLEEEEAAAMPWAVEPLIARPDVIRPE